MEMLVVGLILFIGVHSIRIFSPELRDSLIKKWGEKTYKGLYSLVSLLGFILLVIGFSGERWASPMVWEPPTFTKHIPISVMLPAMIFMVASQVPHNFIKEKMKHPMLISVKIWALAHLMANGRVVDLILFGTFLVWSVLCFRAARKWDRITQLEAIGLLPSAANAIDDKPSSISKNLIVLVLGIGAYAFLVFGGHFWLFGVSPI